jgi:hypothetical protein
MNSSLIFVQSLPGWPARERFFLEEEMGEAREILIHLVVCGIRTLYRGRYAWMPRDHSTALS